MVVDASNHQQGSVEGREQSCTNSVQSFSASQRALSHPKLSFHEDDSESERIMLERWKDRRNGGRFSGKFDHRGKPELGAMDRHSPLSRPLKPSSSKDMLPNPSEEETWRILRDVFLKLNGTGWFRSDGWLSQTVPICEWYGVTCMPRNSSKQWKPVIGLELTNNNCAGTLPDSLGALISLNELDVSSNTIVGTIPKSLGNLTRLVRLDLSDNIFNGTIPDLLSETFATLEHLDLGGNLLIGPLPTSFFYLTRLAFLNLSSNAFFQPLPDDIAALSSLHKLYLSHNQFYGSLPTGLGSLSELIEMDVSHNSFSGELLPDWAASLTSLQVFVASSNNFSGSTAAFGYMANIRKLFLDRNALSGEIHPYLYQLSQSIAIDLSYNFLSGWVTESLLSTLLSRTQLIYLNLVGNPGLISYEARIPPFLGTDPSISTHNRFGSYACRRLYLRTSRSTTLMVDPAFFSYKHCSCIRDSYGSPPDECYDCPPGAYCIGSNFFTFDAGWYPIVEPIAHRSNTTSPSTPQPSWTTTTQFTFRRGLESTQEFSDAYLRLTSHAMRHQERSIDYAWDEEDFSYNDMSSKMRKKPTGREGKRRKQGARPNGLDVDDAPTVTHGLPTPGVGGMQEPLGWMAGPVLLYPCPDLSGNSSSCNPTGDAIFYYNSSKKYGVLNNETLCAKGYDLRLCSFCTCAAASNPKCRDREGDHHEGTGGEKDMDCSCYYRSSMKCVKCERVWPFPQFLSLVVALFLLLVFLLAFVFYSKKAPKEATLLRFEWIAKLNRRFSSFESDDDSGGLRHSGYLKILIVYLQTLSIVTKDPILIYFKLTLGEVFSFGAICAWPFLSDPFMQHLFFLLLPVALMVAVIVALVIAALASKIALQVVRPYGEMPQEEDYVNDHLIYGGGGLDHNNPNASLLNNSHSGSRENLGSRAYYKDRSSSTLTSNNGGSINNSNNKTSSSSSSGASGVGGGGSIGDSLISSDSLHNNNNNNPHHQRHHQNGRRVSVSGGAKEEYSLVSQGMSAALFVMWWFLFGVAYRSLSIFNCASDPLSSFLETQPWLGCKSPEYQSLRVLAIVGSIVYLGFVPILFAVLLFVFRRKVHDPNTMSILEILCASYRSGVFWYEMVAMARRISLAAVVALVPGSSAFKMSAIALVLVVALYLQIVFRPFVTKFENVIEELSMVTVLLTYASQFGVNMRFKQMGTLNTLTVVFNFLMIAAIVYTYLSRTFFPSWRFLPWSAKPQSDLNLDDQQDIHHALHLNRDTLDRSTSPSFDRSASSSLSNLSSASSPSPSISSSRSSRAR